MDLEDYLGGLYHDNPEPYEIDLSGKSSDKGFDIDYMIRTKHPNRKPDSFSSTIGQITAGSGGKDEIRSLWVQIFVLIGSFWTIAVIPNILYSLEYSPWFCIFLMFLNLITMPGIITIVLESAFLFTRKELRQWHASEHQAIEFIRRVELKQINKTFESFLKCPSVSISCGSTYVMLILETLVTFWLLSMTLVITLPQGKLWPSVVPLILFALCVAGLMIRMHGKITRKKFLYFSPVFILPLLTERYICLKTPTEEKLKIGYEKALEVLKEIKRYKEENPAK